MRILPVKTFLNKNSIDNTTNKQNYVSTPIKNDSFSKISFKGLFEHELNSLLEKQNDNLENLERSDWFILSQNIDQLKKLGIKDEITLKAKELLYQDIHTNKKIGITNYLESDLIDGEDLKEIIPEIKKNIQLLNRPALNKVSIRFILTAYDKLLINADDLEDIIKPALDLAKSNELLGTAKLPIFQLVNRKPIFEQYYPKYQNEYQGAVRSILESDEKQLQFTSNSLLDKILKYNKDNNISNSSYFVGLFDKLINRNLFENPKKYHCKTCSRRKIK